MTTRGGGLRSDLVGYAIHAGSSDKLVMARSAESRRKGVEEVRQVYHLELDVAGLMAASAARYSVEKATNAFGVAARSVSPHEQVRSH